MLTHKSTTLRKLTADFAREVATMSAYKGERPVRKSRLCFLDDKMNDGLFHPPRWSFVTINGMRKRINGQHSSIMLNERNGGFPKGMMVVVDEFEADDAMDVALLFSQFDARSSTRIRSEVVNAHAKCHVALEDVKPTVMATIATGIAVGLSDGEGLKGMKDEDKGKLLHDFTDFAEWAVRFTAKKWSGRAMVIGAMFRTYTKDKEAANTFWKLVCDETEQPSHPTRVLANFLRENSGISIHARRSTKPGWEPRAFYVKCLHAWNHYRSGTTTTMKYHRNAGIPKVL